MPAPYRAEPVVGAQMQRETIGAGARHKDAETDVRVNESDRAAAYVFGGVLFLGMESEGVGWWFKSVV
jgi:hypothetical protein